MSLPLSWVYVSMPRFTFLLGIDPDGIVRDGPPYAHKRRFIGQHERVVADVLRRQGARFERITRASHNQ